MTFWLWTTLATRRRKSYPYVPERGDRVVHRASGRVGTVGEVRTRWWSRLYRTAFADIKFDDGTAAKLVPCAALKPLGGA